MVQTLIRFMWFGFAAFILCAAILGILLMAGGLIGAIVGASLRAFCAVGRVC